ncbi:MAG: hypothetical protein K2K57_01690 [Oscillospiraceae bacterium]|nr:hypothetical protein [Oscillospiraceae bacterium]
MITSMNKASLYATLFGCTNHAMNPYIKRTTVTAEIAGNSTTVGTVNLKTLGGNQKPSETVTPANMDTFTYSDDVKVDYGNFSGLTFERNTDRLEISDEARAALEDQDFEPYEYSDVVDFTNDFYRIGLGDHMKNGIPTEERIAEYYGNIAKRLDAAYAQGKFTKEEYDELNKAIADGMEWETGRAERIKARFAIGAKIGNLPYKQSIERIRREKAMTPEQCQAEMQAQIAEYVSRYTRYDRGAILKMFNSIRYGK